MALLNTRSGLRAAAILIATAAAGCSGTATPSRFEPGKPAFQLTPESVIELAVSSDDPATGTRWSAQFEKSGESWRIVSGPEGTNLTDRLADSGFIRHLLDTLKTLRVSARIENTGDDLRSRLGLAPAVWWLRWREQAGTKTISTEIRLGSHADPFRVNAESSGEFFAVEGAALKMLEHIREFRTLRHHKLMTWPLDHADRLELDWRESAGLHRLSAERVSGEWAKTGGPRLADAVQLQIERLSMLEIARFEEQDFGPTWLLITWKNRENKDLRIEIDRKLRARASDRPGAFFALPEEARSALLPRQFGIRTRQ